MARADLLCEIIKYGIKNDNINFRKAAEAICAEERAKKHTVLADKIENIIKTTPSKTLSNNLNIVRNGNLSKSLFWEKIPKRTFSSLILEEKTLIQCKNLVEEQMRSELLYSYGLEPRNKILLIGPPGNGKTSLAEAIAEALTLPLFVVKYESIVGSYLGETASRLAELFELARSRSCVLFFDEFETLGKERGDTHEMGEIKRVVSSLLLQIDALPSYTVVIAATNHEHLLDKAAWRRFQVKLKLDYPTRRDIEKWFITFQRKRDFNFGLQPSTLAKKLLGLSYAEIEEIALSIYRQYVLQLPNENTKHITETVLKFWIAEISKRQIIVKEGEENA